MANRDVRLITKRTSVPGKIPTGTTGTELNLVRQGELASNLYDRKLYSYDGSNIFEFGSNSFLGLTGGTITGNTTIKGSLTVTGNTSLQIVSATSVYTNYIDFNTAYVPTQQEGRLHWDVDYGTLDVDLEGNNINLKVGLDNLYYIKNQSGATINKGRVVRAAGTLGGSGRILGEYMIADGTIPYYFTLGIAGENILNGEDGYVYEFGLVRGLNTTGSLYGETWVDGTILYVSSTIPGGLTSFEPIEPNLKIQIAIVINAAVNGSLFVRPSLSYNLNDLHNVQTSGETNGDLISYNSSQGYWEYTKTLNGNYIVNGHTIFSSTTDNVVTIVGSGSTNPLFTVSGSSGELFSVSDNLTGELLSVNNINSESIFVVNDDNTILMGDYPTLSLNTTINVTVSAGTSEILYIIPSGYTSSYFDYNVFNAVGVRAGNVMGIWNGSSVQYTEVSTNDIGNTDDIGIYMEMSGSTALFKGSATTYNWVVKSIVRSI